MPRNGVRVGPGEQGSIDGQTAARARHPATRTELGFVDGAEQQGAGGIGATQAVQEGVCCQQLRRDVQQLQRGREGMGGVTAAPAGRKTCISAASAASMVVGTCRQECAAPTLPRARCPALAAPRPPCLRGGLALLQVCQQAAAVGLAPRG